MPTIEFTCYNDRTLKETRPILASKVQPEWWKGLKINEIVRGDKQQTIRACPAMQDWLTMGYYLIAEKDMYVQIGRDKYDESGKASVAWSYEDPKLGSSSHPDTQFGNAFEPEKRAGLPVKDAFKFRNAWNIKTPPGYSCLYLDPFLHQNNFFSVWPGIIDTDKFNLNMDNSQVIFYPKVDHSFVIKKGTPLTQIIPFRREEWNSSAQVKDPKTFIDNLSDVTSVYGPDKPVTLHMEYAEWQEKDRKEKEKFNESRIATDALMENAKGNKIRKSVQGAINEANLLEANGLGPYRKVGMHMPKTKLYKNKGNELDIEIPPECPMHKKTEESPEIQLEMDFNDKQRELTDLNWDGSESKKIDRD